MKSRQTSEDFPASDCAFCGQCSFSVEKCLQRVFLTTFILIAEHVDDPMIDKNTYVTTCEHHTPVRSLLEKERLGNVQIGDRLEDAKRHSSLPECGIVVGGE